jgi:DNA-binding LacI/PurR family transcriptional regulator
VPSTPLKTTFDQIILDRCQAICDVADHFAATRRRRPVYLSTENPAGLKVEAFLKRLQKHGFGNPDQYYIPVHHSPPDETQGDGYIRALSAAWDDSKPFDAILCTTDEGSAAVMRWLQERNYRVPEDVAMVGFNDNEQSRFMHPSLASVNRRNDRLVELIEKMLFARLSDPQRPVQKEKISMKFICRESAELHK